MIVGPDFVWLHFPKCGGVAAEAALRKLLSDRPDVVFDPIDNVSGIWHDNIHQRHAREPSIVWEGRRIISGIRRLPSWLLSKIHFEMQRGGKPPTREMILRGECYEEDGAIGKADNYILTYNDPPVDFWVRTEKMADDIASAFDLDASLVSATMERANETVPFVKDVGFWFTPADLRKIYDSCPLWADVERQVYGSTLAEPSPVSAVA